ncbi:RNA-binding domain-containing protein [Exidia glandulosa HHB12029]|uniref:RNA-binding domain-containing protein n=1 Tax=Exidia glandulosa HHB12029 TaxID=1314781 RepID=A0A165FSK2_EXIGL|nr:RNA-binding domain-containing protein [Exidia glandulosa HHB12029]
MPRILFVSGFHAQTRARDLAFEFEKFGALVRCDVPAPRNFNANAPYAFVEFRSQRDAEAAYHEMHGRDFEGQRLSVQWARNPPSAVWRFDRGGGGGRGSPPPRERRRSRERGSRRSRSRSRSPRRGGDGERRERRRSRSRSRDRTDRGRSRSRSGERKRSASPKRERSEKPEANGEEKIKDEREREPSPVRADD